MLPPRLRIPLHLFLSFRFPSPPAQVRTIKEEEPTDSFFNFFDPPAVPEEDDEMDEEDVDQLHEQLEVRRGAVLLSFTPPGLAPHASP